ncbi:TetR/AcrR family transcriptional regulator C-terminal domain-containing protein [Streptomyces sp. NPDC059883]|uniref:TetR/AcrR family transcriptional regulator C-terminal domain-containing protein n=1 Tax=unclassified Streptomyces TaxID=2593676 RepID=UPI003669A14C
MTENGTGHGDALDAGRCDRSRVHHARSRGPRRADAARCRPHPRLPPQHRDGGRLVAGTFTGTGKTPRVADTIAGALLDAGHPEPDAARLCWSIVYFTLGLTQEQQTPSDNPRGSFDDLVATGGYPALARIGEHLMVTDSFDNRFHYGLSRLLPSKS